MDVSKEKFDTRKKKIEAQYDKLQNMFFIAMTAGVVCAIIGGVGIVGIIAYALYTFLGVK